MKQFTHLIQQLSVSLNEENSIKKLINYWNSCADEEDKTYALKLLFSITPKRKVTTKQLKEWAPQITKLPEWLIERSVEETSNFLQAFSLLLRSEYSNSSISLTEWMVKILEIDKDSNVELNGVIKEITNTPYEERLLLLKLLTGTFKSPVSSKIVIRSIAEYLMISPHQVSLRLLGLGPENLKVLEALKKPVKSEAHLMPVSFPEIIHFKNDWSNLNGEMNNWNMFGEKEGIPAQIVKFDGKVILWSQEGEVLNGQFPEIVHAGLALPNTIIIQGQILAKNSFASIETILSRLQKKTITKKELQDQPANFEIWSTKDSGNDIEVLSNKTGFAVIDNIDIEDWHQVDLIHKKCRKLGYSGLLLQKKNKTGTYFYKKASCFSIRAILTYVELDNLNRSGLKSLSFGIVDEKKEILPIAKSDSIDKQIDIPEIIDFSKQNTLEKFGLVRTVKPELIFELHFDSIMESKRRKSGLALSNVSVFRKMNSLTATADTLVHLKKLLE